MSEIRGGYWMYEIDKTEDNPNAKGLAFLIHPKIKDCVTDFKTYSNRGIKRKVNLQGKGSVTVINAYVPISCAEDEKVGQFYDHIERAMTQNIRSLKEILMQKLDLKQKKKISKAWEHLQ